MISFVNITSGRSMGIQATSDDGNVSYRAPIGDYELLVLWQEATVHKSDERVDTDRDLVVVAAIYYAFITAEDTTGEPLSGAQITVTNPVTDRIMGSQTTDVDGKATYRLPMDNYSIEIIWLETVVFDAILLVDNNEPMILVVSVYYAEVHVEDSTGMALESALVTFTNDTSGRQMGERTTPEDGIVTFRLPIGYYDIEIVWQETIVWYQIYLLNNNDPLIISANVYYAELHVVDSTNVSLESALVTFTNSSSGRQMEEHTTPEDGIVTFKLPIGYYDIEVVWQEATVWYEVYLLNNNDPLIIVANVFYAELHVVDSTDVPLESALVVFTNDTTGRLMGERTTPEDGIVTFRLPMGEYDVVVVWQEAVVWHQVRMLDDNEPWTVVTNVFYGELHIMDSLSTALETALVSLTNTTSSRPMGDRTTGNDGIVIYRLPMGTYTVQVLWKDTLVHNNYVIVDSNVPIDVITDVYYPTYEVIDSQGVALQGALITLSKWPSGRIMGSQLTDFEGGTTFRMPMDTYTASIVWLDTLVHQANYGVDSNTVYQVTANVFYLDYTAEDSRDVGLEFAQIVVTNSTTGRITASHTTDVDGYSQFRLPIGVYDVEVLWQNTPVYDDVWTVDADATEVLTSWVYYVTFHVADVDGVDLSGASVALVNDMAMTTSGPVNTDAFGEVEFRLPTGAVNVEIVWKSVVVYTAEAVLVHSDATEEISAWVYYMTVKITDSNGAGLKGADVHIDRDGVVVESITTRNGTVVFRLPGADYWANMSFTTTYYLTPIDVSRSENVTLSANYLVRYKLTTDEYQIPFYMTNLFWVILVIVLLIIGLVFLLLRMRKAAMEGDEVIEDGSIESSRSDLDDLLEDMDASTSISAGAAAGTAAGDDSEPEEYSDDDLEEAEDDEVDEEDEADDEPEEYSDDDLEEEDEEKEED